MAEASCGCKEFARLEGASVPAYISAFLSLIEGTTADESHYRCRVCGREWEKRSPSGEHESRRPYLVRLA